MQLKGTDYQKFAEKSTHSQAIQDADEFFIGKDLEKFSITSLAH